MVGIVNLSFFFRRASPIPEATKSQKRGVFEIGQSGLIVDLFLLERCISSLTHSSPLPQISEFLAFVGFISTTPGGRARFHLMTGVNLVSFNAHYFSSIKHGKCGKRTRFS